MSILASLMANWIFGGRESGEGQADPRITAENRAAVRKQYEEAATNQDYQAMDRLLPQAKQYGIDDSIYRNAVVSPDQQQINVVNQAIMGALGLRQPTPTTEQTFGTEIAPDLGAAAPVQQAQIQNQAVNQRMGEIFTPEYMARNIAHKTTGLDPGEILPAQKAQWFTAYSQMDKNMLFEDKIKQLSATYGFIPSEVAHLKDSPIEVKRAITQRDIISEMVNPKWDELAKKLPGDYMKNKMGIITTQAIQNGGVLPEKYEGYFDDFWGLSDNMVEFKAREAAAIAGQTTLATKRVQETVEAESFPSVLGREKTKAQAMRDINKPYMSEESLRGIKSGMTIAQTSQRRMEDIKGMVGTGNNFDLDKLPVGVGEMWRKKQDKYGVGVDEARVRLRTFVLSQTREMYAIMGKQLAVKEVELGQQLINSMDESPTQFVEKYDAFIQGVKDNINNEIKIQRAAGKDVGDLEAIALEVNQIPGIKAEMARWQSEGFKPSAEQMQGLAPGKARTFDGGKTLWTIQNGQIQQVQGGNK